VARPLAHELVRITAWVLLYAAAFLVGHRAIAGDSGISLFWPASGIAIVWIATSIPGHVRAGELVLLGAVAAGMTSATGGTGWESVEAFVGAPVAAAIFVTLARRWAPGIWSGGRFHRLATLREYGGLVAAAIVAGVAKTAVAIVTLLPEPGRPFERAGEIAVTHTVSMIAIGGSLVAILGWFGDLPEGDSFVQRAVLALRRDSTRVDAAMAAVVVGLGVLVFLAGFVWFQQAPVSFVLVMLVVGVAIRFSASTTAAYSLCVIGVGAWLTVSGYGPIAGLPDAHRRAFAFSVFSAALSITGLTIALSRRERDATIAQLQESERAAEVIADDLRLVLANLEEGVAVVEEGGRFIHANAAIGRLLEMPRFNDQRVEDVDTYSLVHLDGTPLLESEIPHVRVFAGEEDVHDVLRLNRPDLPGERIFEVWSRMLPQIRSTDKPRAVTMIRDATAEHQQRDALTSFAQVVAHDLRSPLTSVELWARELLDSYASGPVSAETGTMMLRHIISSSARMQNFISDLLAYAVARDQTPSPVKVELTDVVESVVETIAAVDGTQPDVRYENLPGVWCDPVLVPQLFDNLIGNARKYVAAGVVPEVRIEATPLPGDWAKVRVLDNGIGIAPEDRVRVFDTFVRARANEYDGTGLGLAICRHIVERHGGTIAVTNPPEGNGTCIELTLPMTDEAFEAATARAFD
jgi:signal transduction histidine kinase